MRSNIIAFALGVCLLQQQAQLPSLVWALALLPVLLAWWWLRLTDKRPVLLLPAIIAAAGFFYAAARAEWRLAGQLPRQWEGVDLTVTGVVASLPQPFEGGVRFDFDVEQVAPIHAGERWRLIVRLRRPHGGVNPYGFDYESWLLQRAVGATGYVRPGANARLDGLVLRPAYLVERGREILRARHWEALPGYPYAGVLTALAIGDQNAIDADFPHERDSLVFSVTL